MLTTLILLVIFQLGTMAALTVLHQRQKKIMIASTAGMKALLEAMSILQNENMSLTQHYVNLQKIVHHTVDKTAMIEEVVKYLSETNE
jgi:hypothetical protein